MFAKISLLCLALCSSGIRAAPQYSNYPSFQSPTLTATHENVYRSPGNLASISTQGKSISTPFSSSNKHFTSITNPGVYATAPLAYASPAAAPVAYAHAAPAGPIAYHAPAAPLAGASLLGVKYSPAVVVSHMTYSDPIISYAY